MKFGTVVLNTTLDISVDKFFPKCVVGENIQSYVFKKVNFFS